MEVRAMRAFSHPRRKSHRTIVGCEARPFAVLMLHLFRASAMPRMVVMPAAHIFSTAGRTSPANPSARARLAARALTAASAARGLPSFAPAFLRGARRLGPRRDQGALLFGERGIEVKHERVNVGAELGDDKGNALDDEAADEMHVAR